MRQFIWLVALLTISPVIVVAAGDGDQAGVLAYQHGDYTTALQDFRVAAASNDPRAQYNIGNMYAKGQGVPQDYVRAAKWLRRSADGGSAEAQSDLGAMYELGEGVRQSDADALKWLRLAANQGFAAAQISLGAMYANGRGVPSDDVKAYEWTYRALGSAPPESKPYQIAAEHLYEIKERMSDAQYKQALLGVLEQMKRDVAARQHVGQ